MMSEIITMARQIVAQLPADKTQALEILEYARKLLLAEPDTSTERPALKIVEKDR